MEETDYIWKNGTMLPWESATTHVLTHTLHYGGGVFEGLRVYDTERGPAIFRLPEHIERLFYSASALQMQIPFSQKEIVDACIKVVRENKLQKGYVRPIAYYGYGKMGVNPKGAAVDVAIACWPWGAYLPHDMIEVKVSSFIRIHPKTTVADAKISGHYVNSILAVLELSGTKYHEALFLDFNGNVAEGPGENLFVVKNGAIFTPQLGTILPGITRATVMELARSLGFRITETNLTLSDVYTSDEAFFTGTAAEVTPIRSVNDMVIGKGEVGPLTSGIRKLFFDVVHGRIKEFEKFVTFVNG